MFQSRQRHKLSILNLKKRMEWLTLVYARQIMDDFAPIRFELPEIKVMEKNDVVAKYGIDTSFFHYIDNIAVLSIDAGFSGKKQWYWSKFVLVHELLHKCRDFLPTAAGFKEEIKYQLLNVFRDCKNEQFAARTKSKYRKVIEVARREVWNTDVAPHLHQPTQAHPLWEAFNFVLCSHTYLMGRDISLFKRFVTQKARNDEIWEAVQMAGYKISSELKEIWEQKGAGDLVCRMWREKNNHVLFEMIEEFFSLFPLPPQPDSIPKFLGQPDQHGRSMEKNSDDGDDKDDTKDGDSDGADGDGDADQEEEENEDDRGDGSSPSDDSDSDKEGKKGKKPGKGKNSSDKSDDDSSPSAGSPDETDAQDEGEYFDDSEGFDEEDEALDVDEELEDLNRSSKAKIEKPGLCGDIYYPRPAHDLIRSADPHVGEFAVHLDSLREEKTRNYAESGRFSVKKFFRNPYSSEIFTTKNRQIVLPARQYKIVLLVDTSGSMLDSGATKAAAAQLAAMVVHKALRTTDIPYEILCSRSLSVIASSDMEEDHADCLLAGFYPKNGGNGDNFSSSLPILLAASEAEEVLTIVLAITDGCIDNDLKVSERIELSRQKGVRVIGIGLNLGEYEIGRSKVVFGEEFTIFCRTDQEPSFAQVIGETITCIVNQLER
jgi:hypothetical protein